MGKLKIAAVSDLHGILPEITERCDVFIIAGDISPLHIQFNMPRMSDWIFGAFAEWVENIPAEKVILIAGNHDAWLERASDSQIYLLESELGLKYLKNETYNYLDDELVNWKIFGTPYCHMFGKWPFMKSDSVLAEHFSNIPKDADVIISHDPPYNISDCDVILESENHKHIGNIELSNAIKNIDYKLLICGHIHSGSHILSNKCVNVSLLSESYEPTYKVFYTILNK